MLKQKKSILLLSCLIVCLSVFILSNAFLKWFYYDKIYTHRVNTESKLSDVSTIGVEIDLVFDPSSAQFDVYHPPEASKGFFLNQYLRKTKSMHLNHYWLDIKNLNKDNSPKAINVLKLLIEELELNSQQFIIESSNSDALHLFLESGFLVSYYLPQNLAELSETERGNKIDQISNVLRKVNPSFISTKYTDYEVLATHFPKRKKLIWFNTYGKNNRIATRLTLLKIVNDNTVQVLILPE